MKTNNEVTCIVCFLQFCCRDCRWKHEQNAHELLYDCPICRGHRFLCHPENLNPKLIEHLTTHLPLQCRKCNTKYMKMEDLQNLDKCESISELVEVKKEINVDERFDSLYEKLNNDVDNFEAIISVNKSSKTAVITPILRDKHLVDYDSSDTECSAKANNNVPPKTPNINRQKTPHIKRLRTMTPHVKKVLSRQDGTEECDNSADDVYDNSHVDPKTPTPLRNELDAPETDQEITTPTSHLPHVLKLNQIVTTSTPTHSATGGWLLFPDPGNDSPLSEIENADSPSQTKEPSRSEEIRKIKGIIVDSRRLASQDSTEKQVTFQDSTDSSAKVKRVKFADDTIFKEEPKVKRVFRKPKRILTPGPQRRKKFNNNPRFQALLNRFENKVAAIAHTPLSINAGKSQETPVGEHNALARAISFKESPGLENTKDNELFKTCVDPEPNNAIAMFTTNFAASLQTCLASLLRSQDEETEIQFKFSVTKKKVSVQRIADDKDVNMNVIERDANAEKENIWSTITKAVKKVFWSDPASPHSPYTEESSSASKRKFIEITDDESPLNHKRHKFERIRGRPPLRSNLGVAGLKNSYSAENSSLMQQLSSNEDNLNLSF
ncbi:unnamed protein product [Leptosia nina]|uniref:C2H2-type domain-containing protein n=1 Tax=Leptosia nina TaxID=320188 RepID=A0AAV1J2W8_9NEOP